MGANALRRQSGAGRHGGQAGRASVALACGAPARLPLSAGIGPHPELPAPRSSLIPLVKIATDDVGNPRTMNMVLAGALSALCPFKEELWYEAMAQLLSGPKAKLLEINKKAFALGRAAAAR